MMVLADWAHAPVIFVWFEGSRHRFARFDAQTWLEQIGNSWERILNSEEHEAAYQAAWQERDDPPERLNR